MHKTDSIIFFNSVYDKTNKEVLKYVTVHCYKLSDVSDIVQDIYTEVYKVIMRKGISYFDNDIALVMTITKRKLNKYYLFQKRKPFEADREIDNIVIASIPMIDKMIIENNLDQIWNFINEKGEVIKKIFYLYYYLELTIKEISIALKLTESSVKNKLYRTISEMNNLFKGDEHNG